MALADTAKLLGSLELKDQWTPTVGKALKSLDTLEGRLGKIGSHASRGVSNAVRNLQRIGVGAGAAILGGLAASVKLAADFESQLNTINTVARLSADELEAVGDGMRRLAVDTAQPLSDLTQGFYDLVSAGIDAGQAQRVLAASTTLAVGGLATTAETVDLITTALNSYGVSAANQGKESERFADIFAKSIERGKVTAAELASSFAQVGGIAANSGIEIEELAASYAQLTSKGVPAAEAATQIRSALIALTRRNSSLKDLEKQTGRSYLKIAGRKGLVYALELMRKDADKAGIPMIELLGRVEGLNFALATTGPNFDDYNENLTAMADATGTAKEQMDERKKGLNFQLDRIKTIAKDVGITVGNELLPRLTTLATKAGDTIQKLSESGQIERFAQRIGEGFDRIQPAISRLLDRASKLDLDAIGRRISDAFGEVLSVARQIPWGAIGNGLKTASEWAGKLFDVFKSLPPDVQATIVALAGLNKLSGGAIGGIVSELAKGLIKGVLNMNAAVVNINAATVKGPGTGVPGAPGTPSSGARPAARPTPGGRVGRPAGAGGAAIALNIDELIGIQKEGRKLLLKDVDLSKLTTDRLRELQAQGLDVGDELARRMGGVVNAIGGLASTIDQQPGKLKDDVVGLLKGPLGVKLDPSIERALAALKDPKTTEKQVVKSLDAAIAAIKDGGVIDDKGYRSLEGTLRQRIGRAIERGDTQQARKLEAQLVSIRRVRETMAGGNAQTKAGLINVKAAVDRKKLQVRVNQNQRQSVTAIATALANSTGAKAPGGKDDTVVRRTSSQLQNIDRYLAQGAVGVASQPTRAIFGEAGKEAFAILRNPRSGTIGGGEHTVNVTVNIDPRRVTKKQTSSGIYKTYVAT